MNRIVTGSNDNIAKLRDSAREDIVGTFVCEGIIAEACWALGGRMLFAMDRNRTVYCLDATRSLSRR